MRNFSHSFHWIARVVYADKSILMNSTLPHFDFLSFPRWPRIGNPFDELLIGNQKHEIVRARERQRAIH